MSGSANLELIPIELFDHIVSFLPAQLLPPQCPSREYAREDETAINRPSLCSLRLTSKRLYELTERHWYSRLFLNVESPSPLRSFLRKILRNRYLGDAVQHIVIENFSYCTCSLRIHDPKDTDTEELMMATIRNPEWAIRPGCVRNGSGHLLPT